MSETLEFWNKVKQPPASALKKIEAGRLKGKTDISPQWRFEAMTEHLGMCGDGWKYTIDKNWSEPIDGQVMCFVQVSLYVKYNGKWGEAIPAIGGDFIAKKEIHGLHLNDEGYKSAMTDALGKAMTALGVAANVYRGSKYVDRAEREMADTKKPAVVVNAVELLKSRIDKALKIGYRSALEKWMEINSIDFATMTDEQAIKLNKNLDIKIKTFTKD
jgi:hypothetical protein